MNRWKISAKKYKLSNGNSRVEKYSKKKNPLQGLNRLEMQKINELEMINRNYLILKREKNGDREMKFRAL